MRRIRLGAVSYLNARPLVFGLERSPRFDIRYDVPSECARLLEAGRVDVGLIPSIEYLRVDGLRIVPDVAIASRGPVRSVTLYLRRPLADVRSIVMDTGSRTSAALVRVLCLRLFRIRPEIEDGPPDLEVMLGRADAALVIGDKALLDESSLARLPGSTEKIDLGEAWTKMTGLPFVWAFWAGREGALESDDVRALHRARNEGVARPEAIARDYFRGAPAHQAIAARYLRDNIKYYLGDDERAGLEAFYRYGLEAGLAERSTPPRFYEP
jgi:chorismate dehydratase